MAIWYAQSRIALLTDKYLVAVTFGRSSVLFPLLRFSLFFIRFWSKTILKHLPCRLFRKSSFSRISKVPPNWWTLQYIHLHIHICIFSRISKVPPNWWTLQYIHLHIHICIFSRISKVPPNWWTLQYIHLHIHICIFSRISKVPPNWWTLQYIHLHIHICIHMHKCIQRYTYTR